MTAFTATVPELRTIRIERGTDPDLTGIPPHCVTLSVRCQAPLVQLSIQGTDDTLDIPVPYPGDYVLRQTVSYPDRPALLGLPIEVTVPAAQPAAKPAVGEGPGEAMQPPPPDDEPKPRKKAAKARK